MPPVMGAGAFVLASYTQISYLTIIAASALPAVLYFLTVSYFVRIEAKRLGLNPTHTADSESMSEVLKEGWHFIIPMAILVGFLVSGRTPTTSACPQGRLDSASSNADNHQIQWAVTMRMLANQGQMLMALNCGMTKNASSWNQTSTKIITTA